MTNGAVRAYTDSRNSIAAVTSARRYIMKIDKSTVERLLRQDDDQLWRTVQMIASSSGLNLQGVKRPSDLSRLRGALSTMTDGDIRRAAEIIESYKKNGR